MKRFDVLTKRLSSAMILTARTAAAAIYLTKLLSSRRAVIIKCTATTSLLTCLLCGCSIFELKNPAKSSGDRADDPLNIVDVVRAVSPGVMAGMNYEYYFTDDAEFQDYQLVTIRGREIITMLERLRSLSPQSLRVEWQITNKWPEGNLYYYLDNVQYVIYSNGVRTHSGTASFRILDDKISYWKDVPNGAHFFEN